MSQKKVGNHFYLSTFSQGTWWVKLSYILMGTANFASRQIVKGFLFLGAEAAWLFFMLTRGVDALKNFYTLGTVAQDWVMDESLGIKVQVDGDNSMLCLLYGIATIMITIAFILIYLINIKSAAYMQHLQKEGQRPNSFREDVKTLLDRRFHITLMSLPMVSVVVFTLIPLIYMILLAFTNYDHDHHPPKNLFDWVGISNFGSMIGGKISGTFLPLLTWTLSWAVFATATCFLAGVIVAVLINVKGVRFKSLYRSTFVLTIAIPQFVSLLLMRNLLHLSGPVNAWLVRTGLVDNPVPFLTDGLLAKIVVILVNVWVGMPYALLVVNGVLMNLPEDQYEAARVDGANALQIFRKITLPQIIFVMTPNLIQTFISNINSFTVIYLLTGGTPFNSNYYNAGETDLLVTWLYKLTVEVGDYNLASTVGIITFICCAVFSLITYSRSAAFKREEDFQ